MKYLFLIPSLVLATSVFAGNATPDVIAEFKGSVPTIEGWSVEGGIPINIVKEGGISALDFNDSSDADYMQLAYKPGTTESEAMKDQGFTIHIRVRYVFNEESGPNFGVAVRIPGLFPVSLGFWGGGEGKPSNVSVYDHSTGKSVGTKLVYDDTEFATVTAVYRPDGSGEDAHGTLEVSVEGGESLKVPIAAGENNQSIIRIGGDGSPQNKNRISQAIVESFSITTP